MPNLLEERVRRALASTIRIIAKIGEGGMGVVYKGRHLQLDVDVAVKVLKPEIADAEAIERFRREAQLMARFKHPNIIQVLDLPSPDQVDGLHLLVMEYIEGSPLADRLMEERLTRKEALELARQLLRALREVHRHRVVHRDVKPGNVVFDSIRKGWVLCDFGIARVLDTPTLTEPGTALGTREYLPPDQHEWADPSPQLDLYAAAATIYEAYTAEPWNPQTSPTSAGWRTIPSRQAKAIRKGIAPAAQRWRSAEEFLKALDPSVPWVWYVLAAIVVAGVAWRGTPYIRCLLDPDACRKPVELGFVGFRANDPTLQTKATDFGLAVFGDLADVLDTDPQRLPACVTKPWLLHCVDGQLARVAPDSYTVTMRYFQGPKVEIVTVGPSRDLSNLEGDVSIAVLERLGQQRLIADCRLDGAPAGSPYRACEAYEEGVKAFKLDNWPAANDAFLRAIELNRSLVDAVWRLYTLEVWRREDPTDSLVQLLRKYRLDLPETDRALFDAQQAPQGAPRIAMFERAVRRYPLNAWPPLLYGSELFHRGALNCVPLDSSAAMLRQAVANDTTFREAYDQLLWALIRTGKRAAADTFFARYPGTAPAGDFDLIGALRLAYQARFDSPSLAGVFLHPTPTALRALRSTFQLDSPSVAGTLRRTFRFGLSLDIPNAEGVLGLLFGQDTSAATRADGHEGAGLSYLAIGQTEAGLAQIDSAAVGDQGALESAEWRVLAPALGVFNLPDAERERGRVVLRGLARSTGGVGARAAFALSLDARLAGDARTAATWEAILGSQTVRDTVSWLKRLLTAVAAGSRKSYREAMRDSDPLVAADEAPNVVDPFGRSVLHLMRGRWATALGDQRMAACEWRWTDNADFQGWSTGPAQPAEVDWVFARYARTLTGEPE